MDETLWRVHSDSGNGRQNIQQPLSQTYLCGLHFRPVHVSTDCLRTSVARTFQLTHPAVHLVRNGKYT